VQSAHQHREGRSVVENDPPNQDAEDAPTTAAVAPLADAYTLPREEVRRRSLAGVFYLTSSSIQNLVVGLGASIALARLLAPREFGMVAVGSTVLLIGGALADGGLGAGMVRRPDPPTRQELRTLNGIQLVMTFALCAPICLVALEFGQTGAVTALMVASLPVTMLQTPGRILLNREMQYDRQLAVDVLGQTSFQIFAVVAVGLGAGVWGLASASMVRAAVSAILTRRLTTRIGLPSLRGWRSFGPLIRFGLSFQASWFTFVGREQGVNTALAVVGGIAPLGVWTFTNRIFQLPSIAFNSLYTVGFPAMSNLLGRGEDAAPIILRTVRRAAIVGTLIFPLFAATAPALVPLVFGERWAGAADVLPFLCLSTIMLGSIAVASTSYLSAVGRPGVVAWASASLGVVWIAVTAALLPTLGIVAIGIGNVLGSVVEAFILDRATHRAAGVAPHRPLVGPLCVSILAGGLGYAIGAVGAHTLLNAAVAGTMTIGITFSGLRLVCGTDLRETLGLGLSTFRSITSSLSARVRLRT
jgi:O-antigen/teichoic acid export membrane protein